MKLKLLYYSSHLLSLPFYLIAWSLLGSIAISYYIADSIHNHTTYKLWLILHKRSIADLRKTAD